MGYIQHIFISFSPWIVVYFMCLKSTNTCLVFFVVVLLKCLRWNSLHMWRNRVLSTKQPSHKSYHGQVIYTHHDHNWLSIKIRLTGNSSGTSEGNLASLAYIKKKGLYLVVVWILERNENRVASRKTSQLFWCSFTSFLRALKWIVNIRLIICTIVDIL